MSMHNALMMQAASALSVVPLLKTMMVPSEHTTEIAPSADISGVNAFIHSIRSTFTYDVKPEPLPGVEGSVASWTDVVSFTKGMYLSLPQESHESVWHMGFVQPSAYFEVYPGKFAQFPDTAIACNFDIRSYYYGPNSSTLGSADQYVGYKITYVGELALPRVGPSTGISYATSVSQNYSKVRAFAADYKLSSTTISGTNFNMSGTFHSGIISDTRYISQVSMDPSSSRAAYPPDMLLAQSMTKPDDLGGTEVTRGAIDIMGPDYPRQWCSVDVDATDTLNSQWQTFNYNVPTNSVIAVQTGNDAKTSGPYKVAQLWVTPTDTEFYVAPEPGPENVQPPNWQRIYYGAINEDGVLDIDIGLRASLAADAAYRELWCHYDYCANFMHVYAYINPAGKVCYNFASELQRVPVTMHESYSQLCLYNNGVDTVPPGGAPNMEITTKISRMPATVVKSRPRMERSGMSVPTGGKYLGTLVTLSVTFQGQQDIAGSYSLYTYPGSVRVRARNVDAPGRVGPAHIIRYDGLGIGQQMSFAGTTWLQGIALGQLAPFINNNGTALTVPDNIFSKFVELLWATSPKYRRIMTLAEYNQFVKPYFRDLSLKDLMQSINSLDAATASVVRNLGQAAGFLDPLKHAGAGCVKGMFGEGVSSVGRSIGLPGFAARIGGSFASQAVGGALDDALGLGESAGLRRQREQ